MTHGDIQPGDVVYDLGQSGTPKMQVVDVLAEDLAEYREREDFDISTYKNHPHLPVTEDDRVLACVFLPDDPGADPSGNNPYPLPEGRLARSPVENADTDLKPVQDVIVRDVLEDLLVMGSVIDSTGTVDESRVDVLLDAAGEVLDDRLVRDAEELARTRSDWQASRRDAVATDGAGEPSHHCDICDRSFPTVAELRDHDCE
jgi:hypothetical protein